MEFSRPESWSGEPFPSPGDLPNPGKETKSSVLQVDSLPAELPGEPNRCKAQLVKFQKVKLFSYYTYEENKSQKG